MSLKALQAKVFKVLEPPTGPRPRPVRFRSFSLSPSGEQQVWETAYFRDGRVVTTPVLTEPSKEFAALVARFQAPGYFTDADLDLLHDVAEGREV